LATKAVTPLPAWSESHAAWRSRVPQHANTSRELIKAAAIRMPMMAPETTSDSIA
jgi:hypothetical protein